MKIAWPGHHTEPISLESVLPPPTPLERMLGKEDCTALGCAERTGIPCGYIDRHKRRCPTSWCPKHRAVAGGTAYCSLHFDTVTGSEWEQHASAHPDLENRIPSVINWVARAAEDDLVATLHLVCRSVGDVLVSDPVRLILTGQGRLRSWERVWKLCSPAGVSCRVAICVEEDQPNTVLTTVNGLVVMRVATPWERALRPADAESQEWLFRHVVMPVSFALDQWMQSSEVGLRGLGHAAG